MGTVGERRSDESRRRTRAFEKIEVDSTLSVDWSARKDSVDKWGLFVCLVESRNHRGNSVASTTAAFARRVDLNCSSTRVDIDRFLDPLASPSRFSVQLQLKPH